MNRIFRYISSLIFGIAVFLFWWLLHPYALSFQEQNQLFLFTWDYFAERMAVSGGLADYVAEFLTQFCHVPVLGEALIAVLFMTFQRAVSLSIAKKEWYVLSFIAPVMMLVYMSDIYVMLSYMVALMMAVLLCALYRKHPGFLWTCVTAVSGYWLIGPAIFVFIVFASLREKNANALLYISLAVFTVLLSRTVLLQQYPWKAVMFGINYYRLPLVVPAMQLIIAGAAALIPILTDVLPKPDVRMNVVIVILIAAAGTSGAFMTRQKDTVELIAYDQMVRNEDWNGILKRAEKYQPDSELGAVSVNLALFMSRRGEEFPRFKQFGTRGLIQPNVRDFISNASSCEVFWRLGMINESLRYAFDTQESLVNNRKSGRWMSRMAECQILNGRYEVAEKYLDILSHSLFYRNWAENARRYLRNDDAVMSDRIYSYLKSVRYQADFFYYYPEMDKMLSILYHQNKNNVMAAWYYQAWTALRKYEGNDENTYTGNAHGN